MTPEQLDEIERLAEAATPGPYQVASIYPAYGVFRVQVDEPSECVAMCAVSMNEDADEAHVERQEAHARNGANARAIAALLKYALPLAKELREARKVLGLILETDALRSWAFEAGDDGESIYDMVRRAAGKEPL